MSPPGIKAVNLANEEIYAKEVEGGGGGGGGEDLT